MAKISHGAHSWRSEGLAKKYKVQEQIAFGKIPKGKSKKDTKKWCKGKVGREHVLYRTFYRSYNNGRSFDYEYYNGKLFNYVICSCETCGKTFYRPNGKGIRLVIPVRSDDVRMPVQVKVNGKAIPIDYRLYADHHWCNACQTWERN